MESLEKPRGRFITIEGGEGVGKSTTLRSIVDTLSKYNIDHIATREPGGTLISEEIRQLLLKQHDQKMCVDTELLLVFAARAQHLQEVIIPNLMAGRWVICDRFTDASYAYQGAGRGIADERIHKLETWVQGSLRPDYTLLLDAPVNIGFQRARKRNALDRIELEEQSFFERIRKAYLTLAKTNPKRFRVIDASLNLPEVLLQVEGFLKSILP